MQLHTRKPFSAFIIFPSLNTRLSWFDSSYYKVQHIPTYLLILLCYPGTPCIYTLGYFLIKRWQGGYLQVFTLTIKYLFNREQT